MTWSLGSVATRAGPSARAIHPRGRGLEARGRMARSSGLVYLLRRRIAVKLTVTLVAFVGMAAVVGGLYLDQALETFAVESLEARLATVGRLLLDDARALLAPTATREQRRDFVQRVRRSTDERVTLITADGR